MTLLDEHEREILERTNRLANGTEFSLRTLFGGKYGFENYIERSGQRKALGTQFRKAVDEGRYVSIRYSRHSQSPAEHLYICN